MCRWDKEDRKRHVSYRLVSRFAGRITSIKEIMDKTFLPWYDTHNSRKDVIYMTTATATKTAETSCTIENAMEVLFGKLDEAIDDMENGRVQTIEEAWKEIDSI